MKVLFYNWAPISQSVEGGGINIYLRNIFNFLGKNSTQIEPFFLSSGFYYDKSQKTRLREDPKYCEFRCFSIVNSPVVAPMINAVNSIRIIEKDTTLLFCLQELVSLLNGVDIIHFESLEGLSLSVLRIKKFFPNIKIIHSVHDYGVICPNVMLWTNNKTNCALIEKQKCFACNKQFRGMSAEDMLNRTREKEYHAPHDLLSISKRVLSRYWFDHYYSSGRYKKLYVTALNKYSDLELCVSNRVKQIVIEFGLNKNIVKTEYIGSAVAENSKYCNSTNAFSNKFTLLYMGYARVEKGFFWLLDVLEENNDECEKINIKIASRLDDQSLQRVEALQNKYNKVTVYNGYSHLDFPEIMNGVNLGIVPPIWEDNFPQVGIEMVANGIPVITSNNGGARELNTNNKFHFSDKKDFLDKLKFIINNRQELNDYWQTSMKLTTMKQHLDNLIGYYQMLNTDCSYSVNLKK